MLEKEIWNIPIVGGPGGGKSTILSELCDLFTSLGYLVLTNIEVARMFFELHRMKIGDEYGAVDIWKFQQLLLKTQIHNEDILNEYAKHCNADKVIIFHDRGILDQQAYLEHPSQMEKLLGEVGLELGDALQRYDTVIDLVTAADGAEEYYVNDETRKETPAQARALERGIQQAWASFGDRFDIIDNSTNFENKIRRAKDILMSRLGHSTALPREYKHVITQPDISKLSDAALMPIISHIEQAYLVSNDPQKSIRVRKRVLNNSNLYTYAEKQRFENGDVNKIQHQLTGEAYTLMRRSQIKDSILLEKYRHNFIFENQYFQLDHFLTGAKKGEWVLEILKTLPQEEIKLPYKIFDIQKDVTNNPEYMNKNMACV